MKRTLLCVLTAMTVMSSCVTALAGPNDTNKEVYNGAPGIENVEATVEDLYTVGGMTKDHKTIIITRTHDQSGADITDEVKYVDQGTSAFSKSLEVMFANNLTPGYYKATMGTVSDTSNSETVYFVVGDFEVDPADKLTVLDEATAYGTDEGQTWYKKSFSKTVTYDEYNSFKSIKLVSADGTTCLGAISFGDYTSDGSTPGYRWGKTNLTGSGEVTIALQVYAIPADSTGLSLYFSTDAVVQ